MAWYTTIDELKENGVRFTNEDELLEALSQGYSIRVKKVSLIGGNPHDLNWPSAELYLYDKSRERIVGRFKGHSSRPERYNGHTYIPGA
jgi:hypothetical protein